jgi:hypothetical protein
VEFQEKIKYLDVMERALALTLILTNTEESLLEGFEVMEKALQASPLDPHLNLLMGEICGALFFGYENEEGVEKVAVSFKRQAEMHYRRASGSNEALLLYAIFLKRIKAFEEAENTLIAILENSLHSGEKYREQVLLELIELLDNKSKDDLVAMVRAKELIPYLKKSRRDLSDSAARSPQMAKNKGASGGAVALVPEAPGTKPVNKSIFYKTKKTFSRQKKLVLKRMGGEK